MRFRFLVVPIVISLGLACGDYKANQSAEAEIPTSPSAGNSTLDQYQFKLDDARALLVAGQLNSTNSSNALNSNLLVLDRSGEIRSALEKGPEFVASFAIPSADHRYVYLGIDLVQAQKRNLVRDSACALFRLDTQSNQFHCALSHMLLFPFSPWQQFQMTADHTPVQFDEKGRLYFIGVRFNVLCVNKDAQSRCTQRELNFLDSKGQPQSQAGNLALFRYDPEKDSLSLLVEEITGSSGFMVSDSGHVLVRSLDASGKLSWKLHTPHGISVLDSSRLAVNGSVKTANNQLLFADGYLLDFNNTQRPFTAYELPLAAWAASTSKDLSYSLNGQLLNTHLIQHEGANVMLVEQLLPQHLAPLAIVDGAKGSVRPRVRIYEDSLLYVKTIKHVNYGVMDGLAIRDLNTQTEQTLLIPDTAALDAGELFYTIFSWSRLNDTLLLIAEEVRNGGGIVLIEVDLPSLLSGAVEPSWKVHRSDYLNAVRLASFSPLLLPSVSQAPPQLEIDTPAWQKNYTRLAFNQPMSLSTPSTHVTVRDQHKDMSLNFLPVVLGQSTYLFYGTSENTSLQPLQDNGAYHLSVDPGLVSTNGYTLAQGSDADHPLTKQWQTIDTANWFSVNANTFSIHQTASQADRSMMLWLPESNISASPLSGNVILLTDVVIGEGLRIEFSLQATHQVQWEFGLLHSTQSQGPARRLCSSILLTPQQLLYDKGSANSCVSAQSLRTDPVSFDNWLTRMQAFDWRHYRLDVFNGQLRLSVSEDGQQFRLMSFDTGDTVSVNINAEEKYTIQLSMRSSQSTFPALLKFDRFRVSRLDAQGALLGQAGELADEQFDTLAGLSYDTGTGNNLGFDDMKIQRLGATPGTP